MRRRKESFGRRSPSSGRSGKETKPVRLFPAFPSPSYPITTADINFLGGSFMAYDAFLKLDGVTGESQKPNHSGEIDIMSFSWGASNSSSVGTGTGVSVGKASASDFSVMKSTDSASPVLFQHGCDGTVFATGVVTLQRQVSGTA